MISNTLKDRTKIAITQIRNGNLKTVLTNITVRLYSDMKFVGLQIDPKELSVSEILINLHVRHFTPSDCNTLKEGQRHIRLVKANIPQCYIATIDTGIPVYRNWLFKHTENQKVNDYFGSIFPQLNENEAIIEGVFTHPYYRGMNFMPNAIYKILNLEQHRHLTNVLAFVQSNNKASLRGFQKMGFKPFMIRTEKWRFFKRSVAFIAIPEEDRRIYLNHSETLIN